MSAPGYSDNSQPSKTLGLFDRFFLNVEQLAYNYSISVILVSLLLAGLSVWFSVENLSFKNNRGDLVSKNLDYVEVYEKYRQEFDDYDGVMVVVSGENPQLMKKFIDSFVTKLNKYPHIFPTIFHKIDTEYFKKKGLLYLKEEELIEFGIKIESHQDFIEQINASPGLNQLFKSINAEISEGMVNSLLTGFLGGENQKNKTGDLSFLIALEKQMLSYLQGKDTYVSPWNSFLTGKKSSLVEKGYLVSENERLMFIFIVPNEDNQGTNPISDSIDLLRELIKGERSQFQGVDVGLTGEDVIAADEMEITQSDVRKASGIALIGITLLFILAYRGAVKPLLAIFSLIIALCWSIGWATLVVGHLNILTIVFTTILLGLGIDFGIHILERYKEERTMGGDVLYALQKTVQGTGRGNFTGAVTTAMAFGGMIFTDFIGIVELGKISGGGILLCMVSMVLVLPAFISLEERLRKPKYALDQQQPKSRWVGKFFKSYPLIIFVSIVLVIFSMFSLRTVTFDYNLLNLQAHGTEAVKYEMKVIEESGRSAWSIVVLADSFEEVIRKHHALEKLSTVRNVESIVSILPVEQEKKMKYIKGLSLAMNNLKVKSDIIQVSKADLIKTMKKIRFKLQGKEDKGEVSIARKLSQLFLDESEKQSEEITEARLNQFSENLFIDYREMIESLKVNTTVSPVSIKEIPKNLRERYVSRNGVYLINVYPRIDVWNIDQRDEFIRQLKTVDLKVTGNAIHMFESSRLMKEGYFYGGIYAMAAIFIYIIVSFGSLRAALVVLLPVVVGSLWTLGIMDLIGVSFNLANLVILPLIIGIGVVNGVHIVHRYREETEKTINVLSKSTGRGVILSSLTTMIGFGSLMVADHQGIYSLGMVLTLGVGCCLIASITLLPAILQLFTDKCWKL